MSGPDGAIAVIGLAGRFPGAGDPTELWANLREGRESITFFTPEELAANGHRAEPGSIAARGVLDKAENFDAEFFGYTAREALTADPQQRLLLETVWQSLEDAGHRPGEAVTGMFVGARANGYASLVTPANPGPGESLVAAMGTDPSFFATRTSYKLGLTGPSMTVQTACSSSLVAVHLAVQALRRGECGIAVAAGVAVQPERASAYRHFEGSIMSSDGHCRPFDAAATGTVGGEGVAAIVLRPLADALADGDDVYAVIRGTAVNNDGHDKVGYTAPSVAGQVAVLRAALEDAGVPASSIDYLETHGTGTVLGDPLELSGLHQVFAPDRRSPLWLGSAKANIGHLDVASGVASLIKTVFALRDGVIPPLSNFREPNPDAPDAAVFGYPTGAKAWPDHGRPRRAGVSSFGIGGTNAHVVLEQGPPPGAVPPSGGHQVIVLSARTEQDLTTLVARTDDWIAAHPEVPSAGVARTLQTGRSRFGHRAARVIGGDGRPDGRPSGRLVRGEAKLGKAALAFSGQGTQRPGAVLKAYRRWDALSAPLDGLLDRLDPPVRDLVFGPAASGPYPARIAQPALFAEEYAGALLLRDWGVRPVALTGNSIGEYVAACLSGLFTPSDAAELVGIRAELCQERCAEGRMLAVAAGADQVRPHLGDRAWVAVDVAPGRCTVSGTPEGIETLRDDLMRARVASKVLPVDRAYHSPLMEPMAEVFAKEVVARISGTPGVPLLSSVTGEWLTAAQAADPEYWAVRHLLEPVRLGDTIGALAATGAAVVNVGPYDSALCRAHPPDAAGAPDVIPTMPAGPSDLDSERSFLAACARLWVGGLELDWAHLAGPASPRAHPPTYPFAGGVYWPERAVTAPARAAEPAAEEALSGDDDGDVAGVVNEIFHEVLGRAPSDPAVTFFELGGDSLTASQVVARIRDAYSVVLTPREFYDNSSVLALTRYLVPLLAEENA